MGKNLDTQAVCLDPNPSSAAFDDLPLQFSSGVYVPKTSLVSASDGSMSQVIEEIVSVML